MASQLISFRIGGTPDEDKAVGVLESWLDADWAARHIMTQALLELGGHRESTKVMVSLDELRQLVLELQDKISGHALQESFSHEPNPVELDRDLLSNISRSYREGKEL